MGSQTRTESAIDYESTPLYVTTLRNATLTETISPTRTLYNISSPGTGGTFYSFNSISSSPFISSGVSQRQFKTPSTTTCVVQDGLIRNGMANDSSFWISQNFQARPVLVRRTHLQILSTAVCFE